MTTFREATANIAAGTIPTFDGLCYGGRDERTSGAVLRMDDDRTFVAKRTDEPRADRFFAGCDWRLGLSLHEIAINLRITGRTIQMRNHDDAGWVRCRIEYVGDCEPSTFTRAWLRVF